MSNHLVTLESSRIKLRPFATSDFSHLKDLDQDPEVMKYVGNKILSDEEIKKILDMVIDRQSKIFNYGTWMADVKNHHGVFATIGWFTLKPLPQLNDEFEVGYRLKRQFWGRGFATEGTGLLLRHAFDQLKLSYVIGLTHLQNKASQNVLLKSGLQRQPDIVNPWDPQAPEKITKFVITRERYVQLR